MNLLKNENAGLIAGITCFTSALVLTAFELFTWHSTQINGIWWFWLLPAVIFWSSRKGRREKPLSIHLRKLALTLWIAMFAVSVFDGYRMLHALSSAGVGAILSLILLSIFFSFFSISKTPLGAVEDLFEHSKVKPLHLALIIAVVAIVLLLSFGHIVGLQAPRGSWAWITVLVGSFVPALLVLSRLSGETFKDGIINGYQSLMYIKMP